jgi:hypothetical protein
MASITPAQRECEFHNHDKTNMIRARIKSSPLKMCYYPWFKHFDKQLADNKVAAWTGHPGAALEHFHKHMVGVVLELWVRA